MRIRTPLTLMLALAALPAAGQELFSPRRYYCGLLGGGTALRVVDQDTGQARTDREPGGGFALGVWLDPLTSLEMQFRLLGQVDVGTTYDFSGNRVTARKDVSVISFGYLRKFPLGRKAAFYGRPDLILWNASSSTRYSSDDDSYYDPDHRSGVAFGLEAGVVFKVAPRWELRAGAAVTTRVLDGNSVQWTAGLLYSF